MNKALQNRLQRKKRAKKNNDTKCVRFLKNYIQAQEAKVTSLYILPDGIGGSYFLRDPEEGTKEYKLPKEMLYFDAVDFICEQYDKAKTS